MGGESLVITELFGLPASSTRGQSYITRNPHYTHLLFCPLRGSVMRHVAKARRVSEKKQARSNRWNCLQFCMERKPEQSRLYYSRPDLLKSLIEFLSASAVRFIYNRATHADPVEANVTGKDQQRLFSISFPVSSSFTPLLLKSLLASNLVSAVNQLCLLWGELWEAPKGLWRKSNAARLGYSGRWKTHSTLHIETLRFLPQPSGVYCSYRERCPFQPSVNLQYLQKITKLRLKM